MIETTNATKIPNRPRRAGELNNSITQPPKGDLKMAQMTQQVKTEFMEKIKTLKATTIEDMLPEMHRFTTALDKELGLNCFEAMSLADTDPELYKIYRELYSAAMRHLFKCLDAAEARAAVADAATSLMAGRDSMLIDIDELDELASGAESETAAAYLEGVAFARRSLRAAGIEGASA